MVAHVNVCTYSSHQHLDETPMVLSMLLWCFVLYEEDVLKMPRTHRSSHELMRDHAWGCRVGLQCAFTAEPHIY